MNVPVPFPGTAEERQANRNTHYFVMSGDPEAPEIVCINCDTKPGHEAANYPCGEDPPRMEIEDAHPSNAHSS